MDHNQGCLECNYVYAMVDRLADEEKKLKRQGIAHVWVDLNQVRTNCMDGLDLSINSVDIRLDWLKTANYIEFHRSGRAIRRTLNGEATICICDKDLGRGGKTYTMDECLAELLEDLAK